MRIAIVSDTHLSAAEPAVLANAAAVRRWIETLRPDGMVHLGDIVADGVERPDDYRLAIEAFGGAAASVAWLPGNHDIGEDDITAVNSGEVAVSAASLAAWRAAFGADYWHCSACEWTVIGLNAQLLGIEDERSAAQRAWLDAQLARTRGRLGVMLHKPLFQNGPRDRHTHRRYLPLAARRALWQRLTRQDLRFVVSGHTHQWRQYWNSGVEHVWAPSAAYTFPDRLQETIGRKVVGAMLLDLTPAGHQFAFVEIDGVRQNELNTHD